LRISPFSGSERSAIPAETFVLGQNAEVFAGSTEGFAFTDALVVAELPGQPGLAFQDPVGSAM
jgi:hypothetical protein